MSGIFPVGVVFCKIFVADLDVSYTSQELCSLLILQSYLTFTLNKVWHNEGSSRKGCSYVKDELIFDQK